MSKKQMQPFQPNKIKKKKNTGVKEEKSTGANFIKKVVVWAFFFFQKVTGRGKRIEQRSKKKVGKDRKKFFGSIKNKNEK